MVVEERERRPKINHDAVDVRFKLRSPHKDYVRYESRIVR
jgi:hypothetical protein